MRRLAALLAIAPALLAGSCVVLLDFDELTAGSDASAEAGAICSSDAECSDGDPCTEDRCNLALSPGRCEFQTRALVKDGLERTLSGDPIHSAHLVSLITTGQRFYLAAFHEDAQGARDVSLHQFDDQGDGFDDRGMLSQSSALSPFRPLSAASLVTDTATPPRIHAYVAVGQQGQATGRVHHLVFDLDFQPVAGSGPAADDYNFDASDPRRAPIAWRLGSTVHGAWLDPSGGVYFHSGASALPAGAPPDLSTSPAALRIAPAGGEATPGVVWISDGPHVQLKGGAPAFPLFQCNKAGSPTGISSVALGVGWAAVWTRLEPGKAFSVESGLFNCTETACLGQISPPCDPSPVRVNTRNPALAIVRRASEPEISYQIGAIPEVDLPGKTGRMIVRLRRVTSDGDAGTSVDLDTRVASEMPLGTGNAGPDFPSLAVAGENLFAVAWVEPDTGDRDRVRVQRYRICYPK